MKRLSAICNVLVSAIVGGAVSACGAGPGETEFVPVCLTTQATKAMGECGARTANGAMSGEHYRMMVLDMQGKKQQLEAMSAKMNFEQRATFAQKQFEVLGSALRPSRPSARALARDCAQDGLPRGIIALPAQPMTGAARLGRVFAPELDSVILNHL